MKPPFLFALGFLVGALVTFLVLTGSRWELMTQNATLLRYDHWTGQVQVFAPPDGWRGYSSDASGR